jgi:hypothetical protein
MNPEDPSPVTALLLRWGAGEEDCLNELIPLVEQELRRVAHYLMRKERQGHTFQTTALVNEASSWWTSHGRRGKIACIA